MDDLLEALKEAKSKNKEIFAITFDPVHKGYSYTVQVMGINNKFAIIKIPSCEQVEIEPENLFYFHYADLSPVLSQELSWLDTMGDAKLCAKCGTQL